MPEDERKDERKDKKKRRVYPSPSRTSNINTRRPTQLTGRHVRKKHTRILPEEDEEITVEEAEKEENIEPEEEPIPDYTFNDLRSTKKDKLVDIAQKLGIARKDAEDTNHFRLIKRIVTICQKK